MPKWEVIFVYPGIGHVNIPVGTRPEPSLMIIELDEFPCSQAVLSSPS